MPDFYIADVRKRANPDFNMSPQAIPEQRAFPDEVDAGSAVGKDYQRYLDIFGVEGDEIPEDPVACGLPGFEGATMEWTTDGPPGEGSFGQIDFYGNAPGADEPERFLSLYIFSGAKPEEDKAAMKQLEQYADFSQCLNFPLVLQVVNDPLSAAWQHEALQALRKVMTPLVAAFLKANFSEKSADSV